MILVTGGTGFIGRSLVAALIGRGASVRVMKGASLAPHAPPEGAELVTGDVLDATAVDAAVRGVSAVVHLAGRHDGADPGDIFRVNVDGTSRLADAARRHGVPTFIHISSAAVYGIADRHGSHDEAETAVPVSAYGQSKLESERVVRNVLGGTGTRWIILRPSGVFGPGRVAQCQLYRQIRTRRLWIHAGPTTIVHPLFIADAVQAIEGALTHSTVREATVNIAGDRALSYRDWLAMISRIVGGRLRQFQAPTLPTRALAGAALALWRASGSAAPYRLARLTWRSDNRTLNISRARELLDFAPSALEPALERTIESCRREGRW